MLPIPQLKKILAEAKILNSEEYKKIAAEAKLKKIPPEEYLIEKKIISEDLLYQEAANYSKVPFEDLKNKIIRKDILFLIPEPLAQTHQVVAFEKNKEQIKLATLDASDIEIFEFISKKTGLLPKIYLTSPASLKEALKQYRQGLEAEFEKMTQEKTASDEKDNKNLKQLALDLPVIRIVDTLLEYAIFEGASDIHIEPTEKDMTVRYRIDGILKKIMTLPKSTQSGLVARIKILASLKLDEHRLPQDGRFKIQTPEYKVSFRVSIIPVFDGEKIVMRLLDESTKHLTLEQIGLNSKALEIVKNNIKKPHGMFLVTGPTGCGKTTTLYTILNILNKPGVNISTVEDPVEFRVAGVNQSQINPKIEFTFATGLRALLRQDPDIIMVGEIRDVETAEIAINAAMTGHLVLSTLHTNDATTTLPRLIDMGIPAFLIASTTNVIVAQRLVRKICSNCITSYNLKPETLAELNRQVNIKNLLNSLVKEKIIEKDQTLESIRFYHGKGCKQCNNEGYKGRIGIFEVLEITEEISQLILKGANADELNKAAKTQGMFSILEDGFTKAKEGVTTIEEILRVTKE